MPSAYDDRYTSSLELYEEQPSVRHRGVIEMSVRNFREVRPVFSHFHDQAPRKGSTQSFLPRPQMAAQPQIPAARRASGTMAPFHDSFRSSRSRSRDDSPSTLTKEALQAHLDRLDREKYEREVRLFELATTSPPPAQTTPRQYALPSPRSQFSSSQQLR